jgi:IS4 transposase
LNGDNTFEREIYFFTNLDIQTKEDAIVVFKLYLNRWSIETWFRYLKQVFGLEKVKMLKFQKIKNLCKLLVIASSYFYEKFSLIESEIKLTK